ncbi:helix-turn-helix transcriptional regulator [Ruficoccus amylovorans]|uniref:Helix-turn-helix transcriptional regulator n=1 Tax=Ruficoccus amylovorans TaxID=1804625 RepID=A0A842HH12_9BACT|nr:AraC family transcriptional regulator [Ruficoccus amylovorans]MBC2596015.1 helix-turn-helix transcriptional regulator [Ruficoccus amylovorans]
MKDFDTKSAKLVFAGIHRKADNVREHAHDCLELILINKGSCVVTTGGNSLHAREGDMLMIPARLVHDQVSDGYIDTVYCGLHEPRALGLSEPQVVHLDNTSFIAASMQLLASISLTQMDASPPATEHLLAAMLEELNHQRAMSQFLVQMPARLRAALRFIQENLDQPLTIDSLAGEVCVSPGNLHMMFRKHLNTSPMNYILDLRMQTARTILQTPYLSVKEVSAICGYADVNHFVRTFRRVHGAPPGQWRDSQN